MKHTIKLCFYVLAYAKQLESLLTKKIEMLSALREKVQQFRRDMQEEENLSKNIPNRRPPNK